MKEFNKKTCDKLSKEIEKNLQSIGKKYGVAIKINGGRFSSTHFSIPLNCDLIPDNVGDMPIDEVKPFNELKEYGTLYDVSEDHFGKIIKTQGEQYKFIGLYPNRRKYPYGFKNLRTNKISLFTDNILPLLKG